MKPSPKVPYIALPALRELAEQTERNLNFLHGPDGRDFLLSGPDISSLVWLDRFVWLSLDAGLPPFQVGRAKRWLQGIEQGKDGRWRSVSERAPVKVAVPNQADLASKELASLLPAFRIAATILDPTCPVATQLEYPPHMQLLIHELCDHCLSKYLYMNINEQIDLEGKIVAEVYNDFVACFRRSMMERNLLRRELHNWRTGSYENEANLRAYLSEFFGRNDHVTVVHLRLFHARERASLVTSSREEQIRDLVGLRESRARFFDRMRRKRSLFTDKPGHVWSIVPSLQGGYEQHVTLLFNSAALQRALDDHDVTSTQAGLPPTNFADRIGQYWVDVATSGVGDYRRVDHDKWLYAGNWVHGTVRADDVRRREKLAETLGYLAMRRALVRLKYEPPGEYFGMSARITRTSRRVRVGGAVASASQRRVRLLSIESNIQNT